MKTTEPVKKCLQSAAAAEAHAVVQYAGDAACLDNWGLPKLAEKLKKESLEEKGHLDRLLERIAFVEAYPEFDIDSPTYNKSLPEVIANTLKLEQEAVSMYQGCVEVAWKSSDKGSAELFLKILKDEEEHLNWLEGQKILLDKLGEGLYTSRWME